MVADQTQIQAGQYVTLTYTVDNQTGATQSVFLGATIYSDQTYGNQWSDPANDRVVSVAKGTGAYQRQFAAFPEASAGQTYDLFVTLADPQVQQLYQSLRKNRYLTVGTVGGSASTPTPFPPSQGPTTPAMLDLSAAGTKTTQRFTVGSEWAIAWSYNCSGGNSGNFEVGIRGGPLGYFSPGISQNGIQDRGIDYEHQGGTFYLQITSNCSWHVRVEQ